MFICQGKLRKKDLTTIPNSDIITTYIKLVIKSSNFTLSVKRATVGGNVVTESLVNGLMKAVESALALVVTDGDRTRYQGGLHFCVK